MSEQNTRELLTATLQVAVPLAILEVREWPEETRLAKAREYSQVIASQGDIILYRSGKKGETAKAFTALAYGLACAAFVPGGITFLGEHFCTDHAQCEAAKAAVELAVTG